jgi:hypothetical protein
VDNIKIYIGERGCEEVNWIELASDRIKWQTLVVILLNPQAP